MLASDDNNPAFVGARDPDAALHVVFYKKPVKNEWQSEQMARAVFDTVDFVRITTPGNVLNIVDVPVRDDHKQRFPRQWQAYQNRVGSENMPASGTPITEWPRITTGQAEELKALKFYTVEAIAGASDAQLQGIGMIAGQSVFSFRDDAKRFLSVASADATKKQADDKLAAAEKQIAEEREAMRLEREADQRALREMRDQVQALLATAGAPAKRGRKAKAATVEE